MNLLHDLVGVAVLSVCAGCIGGNVLALRANRAVGLHRRVTTKHPSLRDSVFIVETFKILRVLKGILLPKAWTKPLLVTSLGLAAVCLVATELVPFPYSSTSRDLAALLSIASVGSVGFSAALRRYYESLSVFSDAAGGDALAVLREALVSRPHLLPALEALRDFAGSRAEIEAGKV